MSEPLNVSRTETQPQAPSVSSDLDETAALPRTTQPISEPTFAPPVGPGEVGKLGWYRVVRLLGRGGMGAVYLAVDTRLNRKLALKVMLPKYAANTAAKERFLREARAAAQITHDNVVTVYEADERGGVPYIAMQLLPGYPLDEYLRKKGNPSIPQILRLARETAQGLAAAHHLGLVHRDIKPGNLWLEAPNGRVKVLDFGLAKPVDGEAELTRRGAVVGTPAFMSPEQARGEKVDGRSDLFSLGSVLYRVCTGKPPFPGPSTMAILMALGTQEPRPVRELNPEVPESLAALIHRLLAKNPADRVPSADEVVTRLRAIAEELTAPTALPVESQPQVVYVPIQITDQPENSDFADLDVTDANPAPGQPVPATMTVRKKLGGKAMWIAVGFAAVLAAVLGGVIIIIRNKDGTETKIEVPDGATVIIKDKDGKTLATVGPGAKQPSADASADRKAAEWVLSVGGWVTVNVDGQGREVAAATGLPKGQFTLTGISLGGKIVTDCDLARLRDLKGLTSLDIHTTPVTDAGLAHLEGCKGLTYLDLNALPTVTDAGLAHLKGLTRLTRLQLNQTKVTDAGLAHLVECTALTVVWLDGTQVTDAGLAHFKEGKKLDVLTLNGTRVTDAGLARLKGFTGLTELHLADTKVTGAGLVHLAGLERLRALNLTRTQVGDADLARLAGFKALAEVWLDRTPVTDAGLAHFKDRKITTALRLNGTAVTDAGLAHLKDLTRLGYIELDDTAVTDAGLEHLKGLKELGWLGLGGTKVTDAGLAHLKDLARLSYLNLRDTAVTDAGLVHLRGLTGLTSLNARNTKVTRKGAGEFQAAVPGCAVEYEGGTLLPPIDVDRKAAEWVLSLGGRVMVNGEDRQLAAAADLPKGPFTLTGVVLDGAAVTDAGLANLKGLPGLTHLNLPRTQVTDAGMAHFNKITGLTYIDLRFTDVTDAGLANFKECKGLRFLIISHMPITDAGLVNFKDCKDLEFLELDGKAATDTGLANFQGCPRLNTLYLIGARMSEVGWATFKECKNLVRLILSDTQATDAWLDQLKECKNLEGLELAGTKVTDAGLAELKGLKELTHLWLYNTAVTDTGLAHLKALKRLQVLNVQKTKVTAKGLAEFHAAVPGCKITHDAGTIELKK